MNLKLIEYFNKQFIVSAVISLISILMTGEVLSQTNENESSRPVTGLYAIEIGRKDVLATYLSPLHYSGTDIALSGIWSKAMPFNPKSAIMTFKGRADFTNMLNPAGTARMIGIDGYFSWGMAWRKQALSKLQFAIGGSIALDGGAYYLIRNSNNPVEVIARAHLDLTASLSYPLKVGRLNLLFADNITLPSVGLFFSPQYDETFYEIYVGNHKGLIHPGWWGNNFCIDNLLSITFDFGRTAATLGYSYRLNTQWASNLNTKIYTNAFVIGIVPGGIGLKQKEKKLPENIIYSIY